jgi:hypothetical protein
MTTTDPTAPPAPGDDFADLFDAGGVDVAADLRAMTALIRAAHQQTGKAHTLLDRIRRTADDGTLGPDVAHHLRDAGRSLRAALALVQWLGADEWL